MSEYWHGSGHDIRGHGSRFTLWQPESNKAASSKTATLRVLVTFTNCAFLYPRHPKSQSNSVCRLDAVPLPKLINHFFRNFVWITDRCITAWLAPSASLPTFAAARSPVVGACAFARIGTYRIRYDSLADLVVRHRRCHLRGRRRS